MVSEVRPVKSTLVRAVWANAPTSIAISEVRPVKLTQVRVGLYENDAHPINLKLEQPNSILVTLEK